MQIKSKIAATIRRVKNIGALDAQRLGKKLKKLQKSLKQFTTELGDVDSVVVILKDGTRLEIEGVGEAVFVTEIPHVMKAELLIQELPSPSALKIIAPKEEENGAED